MRHCHARGRAAPDGKYEGVGIGCDASYSIGREHDSNRTRINDLHQTY